MEGTTGFQTRLVIAINRVADLGRRSKNAGLNTGDNAPANGQIVTSSAAVDESAFVARNACAIVEDLRWAPSQAPRASTHGPVKFLADA